MIQEFTKLIHKALIIQLAQKHLINQMQYKIAGVTEGPRAISFEFNIHPRAIDKFAKIGGVTRQLTIACRQAVRTGDEMPIRVANGPAGTLALEVGKPRQWQGQAMWATVPVKLIENAGHGLVVPIGVDMQGKKETVDFANPLTPHSLVAGATGSGKTNEVLSVIRSLARQNKPDEVQMIFIDASMKQGYDFRPFQHLANRASDIITDPAMAVRALQWAKTEMERRGANGYNTPHVFLFVDEVIDFVDIRPDAVDLLSSIGRTGRASGIHLIIVAQNPTRENLKKRDIVLSMPLRFVGKVADDTAARVATGQTDSGAQLLTGSGDLIAVNPTEQVTVKRIIGPLVTPADLANLPRGEIVTPLEFDRGMVNSKSAWVEPQAGGRTPDPTDYSLVGKLIAYVSICKQSGKSLLSASTLGKKMTPMVRADKVERHLDMAQVIYGELLKTGYEVVKR